MQHLVITGLILMTPVQAMHTKTLKIGPNKIEFHVPKDWQYAKKFLKAPLILLGPYDGVRRPAISISHSAQYNVDLNSKKYWGKYEKYKEGRKKWLKKNKSTSLGFLPFKRSNWKNLGPVVSMGHKYQYQEIKFEEVNHFFNCNNTLYNISTLTTERQKSQYGKSINKILKSIKCLK